MYIFGLKDSGKCSSLHYTTTWVFWMHILKLKRSVGRCLLVGQVYTTPLHQFLECTYLIWSPQAVGLAYTTPLHWIFAYIYSNWKGLWKEFRWLANLPLHHYIGFLNVYIRFGGLWQLLKLTLHHYMGFLNAYTQIETVSWKILACWLSLHYTTTWVFWMYIFGMKPSSSWSSLHYTTTLDFCMHISELKGPLERNLTFGQPYTTPLHGFF